MKIDPTTLGTARRYFLMISCIVPRPIAWVGTQNETGSYNLAPFSFFNGLSSTPPIIGLGFSPHEDKGDKDTLRNIRRTEQLTVNIATLAQAEKVFDSADNFDYGESEFIATALTPIPGEIVAAPRVAEAKISLECSLHQIIALGDEGSTLVLAEIKLFHILDTMINNRGTVDPNLLKPLGRLGDGLFCELGKIFKLPAD